jgi:hypothetical protein
MTLPKNAFEALMSSPYRERLGVNAFAEFPLQRLYTGGPNSEVTRCHLRDL